jgi:vacuolar protein sorting-associated protein 33A
MTGFLGEMFEDMPISSNNPTGRRNSFTSEISNIEIPKVILVFFIGGCTFAEISALRFLAQKDDNNIEFVIATTNLINKHTFLNNFIEN